MVLALLLGCLALCSREGSLRAEDLPVENSRLTAREAKFWQIVDVPLPPTIALEAVSFERLDARRIVIGTRRGDIFFVEGLLEKEPAPRFHRFASGLMEVLGLAVKDGVLYATQQCEVTRILDTDGDGEADRFETINDRWGFGGEHEFTFGSRFDRDGYLWTVHCLTGSYTSEHLFRGWCLRTSADGEVSAVSSGLRSPGGIGMNAEGDMFYTESQGPWNGACSLRRLRPGAFFGHPISLKWYDQAPEMGPRPEEPRSGRDSRRFAEAKRIPQLALPAVIFPYRKTCQSASAISLDVSEGRFGPFEGQLFIAEYTLSNVTRVFLEKVNGEYQGACFPFRQGFATGLIGAILTREGYYLTGGTSRGWPARGQKAYSLERVQWTGRTPFEVLAMRARRDGFELELTLPVDPASAADPASYSLETYTYYFQRGYGSPEVDQTHPKLTRAEVAPGGRSVRLRIDGLVLGHVHELHLAGLRSRLGEPLLHDVAYYTLYRLPEAEAPVSR